jgi:tRNA threonylcarbamoyladenosine modification (KEOPS) complex  Pcc1 subunit
MKVSAEIVLDGDASNIEKLFSAEEKAFQNKRACYKIRKEKNKTIFKVSAEDSTALRAVLNSITKMISVYETSKSVICKK